MLPTSIELSDFFESSDYRWLLTEAVKGLELSLIEPMPEILYEYDKKKLECASLSISDLLLTLSKNRNQLLPFTFLKFRDEPDDLSGEFRSGEGLGKNDQPKIVSEIKVPKNFLLGYIIEFTILSISPENISQYLKCVRIPKADSYGKRLKRWHARVLSS